MHDAVQNPDDFGPGGDGTDIGFRPTVPAFTDYLVTVTGTQADYDVPYTWAGVATYDDGVAANVDGTGLFAGGSEGNFVATVTCVSSPSSCDSAVPFTTLLFPVPEPSSGALLLIVRLAWI